MTEKYPFKKEDAIEIKILAVKQPIGQFYIGVAKAKDVLEVCEAQTRQIDYKDGLEKYIGIQRPLDQRRVAEIKEYVKTSDASFPNSIILALNPEKYFIENDILYLLKDINSSNIIDGQHRLAGFFNNEISDFEIILTLYPELDYEEQAYLFSVINTKMTRINPSLASDLFEFSSIETPEKVAHNIAVVSHKTNDNAWYGKIKILGKRETNDKNAILSQSTFTKQIRERICDQAESYKIRDILKRNKGNRKTLIDSFPNREKFIFWEFYVSNQEEIIYRILFNYFNSIKSVYGKEWDNNDLILTKTSGYIGLMGVLDELFKIGKKNMDFTKDFFLSSFNKAKESGQIKEFTSRNYPPGARGEKLIKDGFLRGMGLFNG